MNPLDLRGPDFLAFYIPYAVVVFAMALVERWILKRSLGEEPILARWQPGVYPREGDSYAIALMRGGPAEVARMVLGRLFSIGFIEVDGQTLRRSNPSGVLPLLEPIENQALAAVSSGMTASQAEAKVRQAVDPHLRQMAED